MRTINKARSEGRKFWFYVFLAAVIVGLFGVSMAGASSDGGGACYGTYFVEIGEGDGRTEGIWTLAKDGTVQGTDSAELAFDFSHQQGAWKHTVDKEAQATWIDFSFDESSGEPASYARVEADFVFGPGCDTFGGMLDVLFYAPGEDPLDPNGGSWGSVDDVAFTGRRLNP